MFTCCTVAMCIEYMNSVFDAEQPHTHTKHFTQSLTNFTRFTCCQHTANMSMGPLCVCFEFVSVSESVQRIVALCTFEQRYGGRLRDNKTK